MTTPEDANTVAGGSPVERGVRPLKCMRPRCGSSMVQGLAIEPHYAGTPDFAGGAVVTYSVAPGPARLRGCWKCAACGWSVTAA